MSTRVMNITQRIEQQNHQDRFWTTERHTGVEWDLVTSDWAIWLSGQLLGWAPTQSDGERRLADAPLRYAVPA